MKKYIALLALLLLAACSSTPKLEDDARYVRLATVVGKHEFSEAERKQAQASSPDSDVRVGVGMGIGVGTHGSFGGMMLGMGSRDTVRDEPPQIAKGAIRYTVQPQGTEARVEVMSYLQHKVGDCVKVLVDHPKEYARFFGLKPGEHCE
jgi:hypothetical protein